MSQQSRWARPTTSVFGCLAAVVLTSYACTKKANEEPAAAEAPAVEERALSARERATGELYVLLSEIYEVAEDAVEAEEPQIRAELQTFAERAVELAEQVQLDASLMKRLQSLREALPSKKIAWIEDEARAVRDTFAKTVALPSPPASMDAIEGAHVYAIACAACHGPSGQPSRAIVERMNPPPPDLRNLARDPEFDIVWVYMVVEHGVPTTPMPSFVPALTSQERWNVARFVASMK